MDEAGNYNNVLVVKPWLTPGSHEEKRAHVRPLAQEDLGDVHDTAWEVAPRANGHKATAVEPRNGLKPLVCLATHYYLDGHRNTNRSQKDVKSLDEAKPIESSQESSNPEASDPTHPVADVPKPAPEPRANEPSPLFAHECLTPEHEEAEVFLHDPDQIENGTGEEARILDDCEVEMFPTDREHILQRILTTKTSLDEDETSLNGIPSPTSVPPAVLLASLSNSGQTSPELCAIEEEDTPDTTVPPPLEISRPLQTDQRAEVTPQAPTLSEAAEITDLENSGSSDPSSARENQAAPVDAHIQVLDPGLAALGPRHQSIEQVPTPQTEAKYASLGVDGAADMLLISPVSPKLQEPSSANFQTPVSGRRQSVPGSFEGGEEDVDRKYHFQGKTVGNAHGSSGERETHVDGFRDGQDTGKRDATSITVGLEPVRKYDNLLQAFWRILIPDWLGAILARFPWKSGERK